MRKLLVAMLAVAILLGGLIVLGQSAAAQTTRTGGFADTLVFFEQPNSQIAVSDVSAGTNMQLYMFNLRNLADQQAAQRDPNIKTVITPGSVDDLFINAVQRGCVPTLQRPAGQPCGNPPPGQGFNPFAIKSVREAMHYLIDRNFIVEQIFGGYAVPYTSPYHPLQPDYLRDIAFYQGLDRQYRYDPVKAKAMVFSALQAVPDPDGAGPRTAMEFRSDGHWYYDNALLTITFVIRIEDRRLDIGNYVASQIETLGITVNRDYKPAAAAFAIVYFGDPTIGAWEVYTEGFGFTALAAWQDNFIATLGWTFHSGEAQWDFYTPDAALTVPAFKLEAGQYANFNERLQLMRTAAVEAMKDPTRLLVVAEEAVFISNHNIAGYVYDLSGGPWTIYSARSARFASGPGGTIKIGQPVHWNSQWNPYRGFTWLYDETQRRALTDFGVYYHPHLGVFQPIRGHFDVVTSGGYSATPLNVPSDAMWFNATSNSFAPVGSGVTAVSKITWNYTFGKWHDNSDISMTDVWMELSAVFRRFSFVTYGDLTNPFSPSAACGCAAGNYPSGDLAAHDRRALSPGAYTFLSAFRGAKQTGPAQMEIYLQYWHLDAGEIANIGDIFPTVPWPVHDLMAYSVMQDQTRYHATTAQNDGKVLLDLIRGASLPFLQADLAILKARADIPAGLNSTSMITPAEAATRWSNYQTFSLSTTQYLPATGESYVGGHFYVSNGPYWLHTVDANNRQTVMDNFASYPFLADKWDGQLRPKVPQVLVGTPASDPAAPQGVIPIGFPVTIPITTLLDNVPYDQMSSLDYLMTNPATGAITSQGKPTRTATGQWQVSFTSAQTLAILPGTYQFQVVGVGAEAAVPAIDTKTFVSILSYAFIFLQIQTAKAEALVNATNANNRAIAAENAAAAASAQVAALQTLLTVAIAIAVIAVVISVVSIVMGRRKPGSMSEMKENPPGM